MYFRVVNENVVFPLFIINVDTNIDNIKDFRGYSIYDKNRIACYSLREKEQAIEIADKNKIRYTIENTTIEQKTISKVENVKYQDDIEVIDHVLHNIEPESQRIPNLLKRLDEAEAKNRLIPDLIARLEKTENEVNSLKKLSIL